MKTLFFGGSFDPPHYGHLGVALGALYSGRCQMAVLVPAWLPPHKTGRRRAEYIHRLEMVKLLIAGQKGLAVSDIEGRLKLEPSYSIDVLRAWENEQGEKPTMLIGGDSLLALHTWHNAVELVKEFEILTYPRKGFEIERNFLRTHWSEELTEKLLSGVIPGKFFAISSTEIKKSLEKNGLRGNIIVPAEIPPAVREYMEKNNLYQNEGVETMAEMESVNNTNATERIAEAEKLAEFCAKAAEEKLAENVVSIPVSKVSSITDYLVIATATGEPHLRALGSFVEREVRDKLNFRVRGNPDDSSSGWILLDFGNVMVHLMTAEVRERYSLESLWGSARTRQ